MKNWLVIYLIFSFSALTLPKSYTISIFQLGNFLTHFHDHKAEDNETNIISFLRAHYFEKHHHDANHEEHPELPFQHHARGIINIAAQLPFILPQLLPNVTYSTLTHSGNAMIANSQLIHSASYLDEIWQPPRV